MHRRAIELESPRLRLRLWEERDREPFAEMNADPQVMRFFPEPLTRAQSDQMLDRIEQVFEAHGFGLWVVEIPDVTSFAGFVGMAPVSFPAFFTPAVEIGWRLARPYWGHGYAPEAAEAVLNAAFSRFGLNEVVAFTVPSNAPSKRVMQKLGMKEAGTFQHPKLPGGHPLQPHVLFRITGDDWRTRTGG